MRNKTINKFQPQRDKTRHNSSTKAYLTHKIKEKSAGQMVSEGKIPGRTVKVDPTRKAKKLELSECVECKLNHEQAILAYYRYYPVNIVGAGGMKE